MKHSQLIFNKDLYELSYEDLTNYFEIEKEESLNLEFKSFPQQGDYSSKEAAVKKAVCGLLNSEGGIIIWGAPIETRHSTGNTTAIGPLTPFTSILDRDRMINILSSTISPMPVGIRVQVLKDNTGQSIFVIEVEKSIERPHQYDNRYYVRLDGQTRVAPHYLISALMKSTDFPVIRGHIRLKRIVNNGYNFHFHFKKLLFNTSIYNNDININMRLVVSPGTIIINNLDQGAIYHQTFPIISNGTPLMSNFILNIPANQINNDIRIVLQFGGEKSPSKMSTYTYRYVSGVMGGIADETPFLIEKEENRLPSDISNNTVEQNIEILLNL